MPDILNHLIDTPFHPKEVELYNMEKQLTNEEIAKVFAMYFNCQIVNPRFTETNIKYKNVMSDWFSASDWQQQEMDYWDNRRLVITPLSKISDEDTIELASIEWHGKNENRHTVDEGKKMIKLFNCLSYKAYSYLVYKGYAVPLFFAPNHWANGKTAIELGIAIDKTKALNGQ